MASRRARVPVRPVITDVGEADARVARIGRNQREVARLIAEHDEAVQAPKDGLVISTSPHQAEIKTDVEDLALFAEGRREELTKGGPAKTVRLPSGELRWRMTPPKAVLRGVPAIIAEIRKRRWARRFLRVKMEVSVNKEAMTKDEESRTMAASLNGVTIEQHEDFVVVPNETSEEAITKAPHAEG